MNRNLDVLVSRLVPAVPDDLKAWCEEDDNELVAATAIAQGDELAEGFLLGVLAMVKRNDPRFEQWTDEMCMSILTHDECAVIVE
ncbi:hypothetical protein LCGC14_1345760 [marine sediment metagenome]|uniref:Uncharacterized protein n=1 Tax=marine sediment metagenome TaxID=412755 RepID=A0A0F9KCE0_9ZZZZ